MDAINSWIDEEEVSRLAKSLSEAPQKVKKLSSATDSNGAQNVTSSEVKEVIIKPAKVEKVEVKTQTSESKPTEVTQSTSVESKQKTVSWLKKGNHTPEDVEKQLADRVAAALNKGMPADNAPSQPNDEKAYDPMANANVKPVKSTAEVAEAVTPAVKAVKPMTPDEKDDHEIDQPVAQEEKEEVAEQVIAKQGSMLADASLLAKSAGVIHAGAAPDTAEVVNIASASINSGSIEEIAKKQASEELDRDDSVAVFVRTDTRGTFASMQAAVESKYKIKGLCAIDQDGDVLYDSFADDSASKFTSKVMRDANLMKITDGEVGTMRIKQSVDCILEFVSVKCTRGVVLVVMGMAQGLNKEQTEIIASELLEILNKN